MNTYEKEGRGGQLLLTRQPTRLSVLNDERCLRVPTRSGPLGVKDLSCKSGQDAYLAQSAAAGAAGDEGLFLGTLMNRALSWLPRLSRGVTTCPERSRGTGPTAASGPGGKISPSAVIRCACSHTLFPVSYKGRNRSMCGAMVQRLARSPFKAKIRVRFPLALP